MPRKFAIGILSRDEEGDERKNPEIRSHEQESAIGSNCDRRAGWRSGGLRRRGRGGGGWGARRVAPRAGQVRGRAAERLVSAKAVSVLREPESRADSRRNRTRLPAT